MLGDILDDMGETVDAAEFVAINPMDEFLFLNGIVVGISKSTFRMVNKEGQIIQ